MNKQFGLGLYRVLLILGVVAQLWLSTHYVKREEFVELQKDVSEIKTTLRLMALQNKAMEDHEARLRALEQRDLLRLGK